MRPTSNDEPEVRIDDPIELGEGEAHHQYDEPIAQKWTPEQTLAALRSRIEDLRAAGTGSVTVGDLWELRDQSGMSRTWFYDAMDQLSGEDLLRRDRSGSEVRWHIVPRAAAQ